MKKKFITLGAVACAVCALLALGACSSGADKPASTAPSTEVSTPASTEASTAPSTEEAEDVAVDASVAEEQAAVAVRDDQIKLFDKDQAEHWVITQNVVKTDMSDMDDVKVYAAYNLDGFNVEDKTLKTEAGESIMCLVHMGIDKDGVVTVGDIEIPTDGASQQEDLLKICGNDKELADKMSAACDFSEGSGAELRKAAVKAYVEANNLDVTAFQDYGWDPIEL